MSYYEICATLMHYYYYNIFLAYVHELFKLLPCETENRFPLNKKQFSKCNASLVLFYRLNKLTKETIGYHFMRLLFTNEHIKIGDPNRTLLLIIEQFFIRCYVRSKYLFPLFQWHACKLYSYLEAKCMTTINNIFFIYIKKMQL